MEGDSGDDRLPISTGHGDMALPADEGSYRSSGGDKSPASPSYVVETASPLDVPRPEAIRHLLQEVVGIPDQPVVEAIMEEVPNLDRLHSASGLIMLQRDRRGYAEGRNALPL